MTTEALNDQEPELTPEQEAAADAEFEAAFTNARGPKAHAPGMTFENGSSTPLNDDEGKLEDAPTEVPDPAAEAQAKADADAAAAAAAEAEANAPATITKAELDALRATAATMQHLQDELKRSNDTNAGRFGSLKQTVDAIKTQAQAGKQPSLKQLKRLEGEFPELAQLLREDLEEAFGSADAAAAPVETPPGGDGKASGDAPGAEPADPFTDERVQKVLQAKEMSIVDAVHPGWRDLARTPEFSNWKNALPASAQQLLASTWDASVMSDAFNEFKAHEARRTASTNANKQRGKRLEAGITPTSGSPTGANAVDDDDAFLAGFNRARGT